MLISVTLSSSSSAGAAKLPSGLAKLSNDEIVLIELQGSLEVEATHPSERNGKFIGKLTMDEASWYKGNVHLFYTPPPPRTIAIHIHPSKPTLLIGNHLLEGKIASLPKPFAVLVRKEHKKPSSNGRTSITGEDDEDNEQDSAEPDSMAADMDSAMPDAGDAFAAGDEPSPGWNIAGIVKKKIIFSKRPMPVIGKR
ncbi:hypothetical protein D9619_004156 [Psilocybe cf. subviscida]|uniref:Uncharacterized protein n=1 Tax=Psilocybe cf. subviscida TaxID=2480587 RepID=A0A8H5BSG4_9AGAR|nr:hypothetical protein D9619_004156 [Psilocybe cf. subviscida]